MIWLHATVIWDFYYKFLKKSPEDQDKNVEKNKKDKKKRYLDNLRFTFWATATATAAFNHFLHNLSVSELLCKSFGTVTEPCILFLKKKKLSTKANKNLHKHTIIIWKSKRQQQAKLLAEQRRNTHQPFQKPCLRKSKMFVDNFYEKQIVAVKSIFNWMQTKIQKNNK